MLVFLLFKKESESDYNVILQTLKKFFNKLFHIGTEKDKGDVFKEIIAYHSLDYYNDRNLPTLLITHLEKKK